GGVNDRLTCGGDDDCPGGRCGALFDAAAFASLAADGGAIALPRNVPPGIEGICQISDATCTGDLQCTASGDACVLYALQADNPVSLDSLSTKTDDLFVLTSSERLDGIDRNGDSDANDTVLALRNRRTGEALPLGAPAGFAPDGTPLPTCGIPGTPDGRAIFVANENGFALPAIAFEGDTVAFLESEAGENGCDENGDGDAADTILRTFKLGQGVSTTGSAPRALDPAPLVNGQQAAVSDGKVFFRTSEPASATLTTQLISTAPAGGERMFCPDGSNGNFFPKASLPGADVSRDGAIVAFVNNGPIDGAGDDVNRAPDVFVRDRHAGTTELVSIATNGARSFGPGADPRVSISGDGRFVAFASFNVDLVSGDDNLCGFGGCMDVFVRDRVLHTTERSSVATSGTEGDGHSRFPVISDDGRYVAFASKATSLVPGDTNGLEDVFVRDRCVAHGVAVAGCVPTTERVSVTDDEQQAVGTTGEARRLDMSADGRFVAFDFRSTNLPFGFDTGGAAAVYVRD